MNLAHDEIPDRAVCDWVRVRVPAKINPHLGCGPLRSDGYHDVTTVYQAISLYDELYARRAVGLSLTVEGEGADSVPLDDENLVIRAVKALAAHTGRPAEGQLRLVKRIPVAAGLAGGSADAAAALLACDELWGTGLTRDELLKVAAGVGSDVPFLLLGGTALGTGRGELVEPVAVDGDWHWVVAIADGGLSTPAVYAEIDRLRDLGMAGRPAGAPDILLAAVAQPNPRVLAAALANDLQAAAESLRPHLRDTLRAGVEEGALAGLVSGSGPTCLFLAADAEHATVLAARLESRDVCRVARVAHGPVVGATILGKE